MPALYRRTNTTLQCSAITHPHTPYKYADHDSGDYTALDGLDGYSSPTKPKDISIQHA